MAEKKNFIDSPLAKWTLAVVALLSLGWGVFQTFHVRNPKLQYEITSQAKLFNKAEDLSAVKLLVDTVDVLRDNQNISSYVIRIQNVGNQNLRWSDYDEGLFGLEVNNGVILQEVDYVEASSPYLKENFKDYHLDNTGNFITIPRISLDRNDWYSVSFSVIHRDELSPSFCPKGKIIGQREILLNTSSIKKTRLSISDTIFGGGILAFIIRLFAFLIIWLFLLVIIVYSISGLSEYFEKRREERVLRTITQDSSLPGFLRDDYLKNKSYNIHLAEHYYSHGDKMLSVFYKKIVEYLSNFENIDSKDFDRYKSIYSEINELIKIGYVHKQEDGGLIIPRDVNVAVEKILTLLKQNKNDYSFDDLNIESELKGLNEPTIDT